jgi:hypothetical protein
MDLVGGHFNGTLQWGAGRHRRGQELALGRNWGGTWWLGRGHLAGSPSSTLGAAVGAEVGTDVGAEVGAGVGNRMGSVSDGVSRGCSRKKWEKEAVSAFCDQENKTKATCSSGLPRVDFFHLNALEAVL